MPTHSHPKPKDRAKDIFNESVASLMSHTVRAAINWFKRHHVDLDVMIARDEFNTILSRFAGERKPPSVLLSSFYKPEELRTYQRPRVVAQIWIHNDANKNLARVCIAHEIFHLLCELHNFQQNDRKGWQRIMMDDHLEDLCNQFAWTLCRRHDIFNRNEHARNNEIYFPQGLFDTPLDVEKTRNGQWPDGLRFDAENAFWKRKDFQSLFEGVD